jgi:hypothetical protein
MADASGHYQHYTLRKLVAHCAVSLVLNGCSSLHRHEEARDDAAALTGNGSRPAGRVAVSARPRRSGPEAGGAVPGWAAQAVCCLAQFWRTHWVTALLKLPTFANCRKLFN